MAKSIYRSEHAVLCELLRTMREEAGLTQQELARKLGKSQSYVSDIERGMRRIDLVELRDLCLLLNSSLPELVKAFERRLRLGAIARS